jgi:DNA-binding NarL/FixJ family response regulator
MNGIEAAERIVTGSSCKVLLLSTFNEESLARGTLSSGASGYLLKGCGADEIKQAIRLVHSGHTVFKDEVFSSIRKNPQRPEADLSPLSEREREIVKLVAEGYSNKEAADALGLSEGTVKNHVSAILDKLGLRQRTQIAVYYVSGRRTFG